MMTVMVVDVVGGAAAAAAAADDDDGDFYSDPLPHDLTCWGELPRELLRKALVPLRCDHVVTIFPQILLLKSYSWGCAEHNAGLRRICAKTSSLSSSLFFSVLKCMGKHPHARNRSAHINHTHKPYAYLLTTTLLIISF